MESEARSCVDERSLPRGDRPSPITGRMRSPSGREAFTIIEAVVAFAVLSIAALALLLVHISCTTLESLNHESTMALNEARRHVEEIRQMPFDQIDQANVDDTFDVSHGDTVLAAVSGQAHCGSVTILPEDGDGMKEISVTVQWRSISGGERRIQLACQVCDHL